VQEWLFADGVLVLTVEKIALEDCFPAISGLEIDQMQFRFHFLTVLHRDKSISWNLELLWFSQNKLADGQGSLVSFYSLVSCQCRSQSRHVYLLAFYFLSFQFVLVPLYFCVCHIFVICMFCAHLPTSVVLLYNSCDQTLQSLHIRSSSRQNYRLSSSTNSQERDKS
jgi:hypothetical protein